MLTFMHISELVIANENQREGVIVILADKDKIEMEDEIRDAADAALERNVSIQWCYATPTDVLASLDLPAVTNFRVSFDFCYGHSWNIGQSLSALHVTIFGRFVKLCLKTTLSLIWRIAMIYRVILQFETY